MFAAKDQDFDFAIQCCNFFASLPAQVVHGLLWHVDSRFQRLTCGTKWIRGRAGTGTDTAGTAQIRIDHHFVVVAGAVGARDQLIRLAERLAAIPGVELVNDAFFNEFTLRLAKDAGEVVSRLAAEGVLAGVPGARLFPDAPAAANLLIVATTETARDEDADRLETGLREALA